MKRIIAILFTLMIVLQFAGCGKNNEGKANERNGSESRGYYKEYEWGLSSEAVSEMLENEGLKFVENLGWTDISKYNIQQPVFSIRYDGTISCYNIKYNEKYDVDFSNFEFDNDKLIEVYFQLGGYYSVNDYESIKNTIINRVGENNNKDDELGLVFDMHTATWETDVSYITLFYTESKKGQGMITIRYEDLVHHK